VDDVDIGRPAVPRQRPLRMRLSCADLIVDAHPLHFAKAKTVRRRVTAI
jgi:hypothetical protein